MNQIAKIEEGRAPSLQQQFRDDLTKMGDQFVAALPDHIKPERFQRIVLTAVLGDPALLRADRKSLLESAMRAAQDGLLPDKREGAFVIFNTKAKIDGKDQWINAVQWMPMIGGIIKKIHQSGDVSLITAKVVYGGDHYRSWVDDDGEHVSYEPAELPDYDTIRQVFAMAKTKDGTVYVEALTPRDVEKIRNVSRSKDKGPWAQWWEEMAKKSAIRRLAKRLPLSTEVHDVIQRDNELYDLSRAPDPRPSLQERLAAGRPTAGMIEHSEGFNHDGITIDDTTDQPGASTAADADGSGDGGASVPASDDTASGGPAGSDDDGEEAVASGPDPLKRMIYEECVDGMLRDAMSEPAEDREAKIAKLRSVFMEPQNLGDDEQYARLVELAAETARRVMGKPAEKSRAREYLMSRAPS